MVMATLKPQLTLKLKLSKRSMTMLFWSKKLQLIIKLFSRLLIATLLLNVSYATLPKAPCKSACGKDATLHCVQVENHTMSYSLTGNGSPTVIFSGGTGVPASAWYDSGIATLVAKHFRVFTYDRIYTFNSCSVQNDYMPNTALDVVHRLHQLLSQENIRPPFILVGHSFGGLYMLLYAEIYPEQIRGVVLLDATSQVGPTPLPDEAIPLLKSIGNPQNLTPDNPLYNEKIGEWPSYLQAQKAPILPRNIPVIVMSANKHCLPLALTHEPMCMTSVQEAHHLQQQKAFLQLSDKSIFIPIEGDHHAFFEKQNIEKVVAAIMLLKSP